MAFDYERPTAAEGRMFDAVEREMAILHERGCLCEPFPSLRIRGPFDDPIKWPVELTHEPECPAGSTTVGLHYNPKWQRPGRRRRSVA